MRNSKKMMSAILTALMVQSILTTGFTVTTSAYESLINDSVVDLQISESQNSVYNDFEYSVLDGKVTITGYNGNDTEVVIPSEIENLPVTNIGERCFAECSSLTSIEIPDSVTDIGTEAFSYCINLENVTIPNSVTHIGISAFAGCQSIERITVPNSVVGIDASSFAGCSGLTNITIPNSVTSIGTYAFYHCSSLTSITIPNTVTRLVPYVFYGCSSLESIVLPNSLTAIRNDVFFHCDSLADVYYAGSEEEWQSIAISTKDNDSLLNQATIHYNSVEQTEFEYEVANNGIIITKYTGNDTEVEIPSEIDGLPVTAIGDNAFQYCMNLTSVTIPDSVVSIGDYAFHVSGLTSVTIPENVTSIGEESFGECIDLTSISVNSNNANYSDVNGILFNKNQTAILCYPLGKTETSYIIPDGVTSIGNFTFICCNTLTSVIIPESVTDIGMCAFYNCNNLSDVYYTGSEVQWQNIVINSTGNQWLTRVTIHYNCPNVVLDNEELALEVGQMYTLTATANPPTETTFTWKSNNTSVATVNGSGRVVARGEGTATITVISADGKRAYCTVTVSQKKEIVLDKTELNLSVKEQYTLTPSMSPEDTTVTYTFKSNNTPVATVNKAGRIVARGEGTATITVIGSNGLKAYCTVNVSPQKVLVLDKTELNMALKEQYTLTPSVIPEDTEVTYTFKSDNTTVATVNKAGRIVARGTGTATIKVIASNGLTAVCNITVE